MALALLLGGLLMAAFASEQGWVAQADGTNSAFRAAAARLPTRVVRAMLPLGFQLVLIATLVQGRQLYPSDSAVNIIVGVLNFGCAGLVVLALVGVPSRPRGRSSSPSEQVDTSGGTPNRWFVPPERWVVWILVVVCVVEWAFFGMPAGLLAGASVGAAVALRGDRA